MLGQKSRQLTSNPETTSEEQQQSRLIELIAVYAEETDQNMGNTEPIMSSWSLVSLNSTGIEIALNFSDSMQVSAGYKPDLLVV